jgi:hypothetical protein
VIAQSERDPIVVDDVFPVLRCPGFAFCTRSLAANELPRRDMCRLTTPALGQPEHRQRSDVGSWIALFETGTVHEHFALNADGTSPFTDYVEHAESKRQAYRRKGIDFFETTSAQTSGETLLSKLGVELTQRAVPLERRSYTEIAKALEPSGNQALPQADIDLHQAHSRQPFDARHAARARENPSRFHRG